MQRRDLLRCGSIALALTIAGCTGAGDDTEEIDDGDDTADDADDADDTTDDDTDAEDDADDETDDGTEGDADEDDTADDDEEDDDEDEPDGEASLEIVDEELTVEEDDISTDAWAEFTVENTGDADSGEIAVDAEWYDEGGDFLGDGTERMVGLGAGETWVGRVYALTEAEDVDDVELEGEFGTEPPAPAPEGLEFLEGDIAAEDDQTTFEGRIENSSDEEVDYVEVNVKFYDADGNVMGSEWTNETDVPADTTWSFDLTWRDRRRADQVDDFEVFLADSAW